MSGEVGDGHHEHFSGSPYIHESPLSFLGSSHFHISSDHGGSHFGHEHFDGYPHVAHVPFEHHVTLDNHNAVHVAASIGKKRTLSKISKRLKAKNALRTSRLITTKVSVRSEVI